MFGTSDQTRNTNFFYISSQKKVLNSAIAFVVGFPEEPGLTWGRFVKLAFQRPRNPPHDGGGGGGGYFLAKCSVLWRRQASNQIQAGRDSVNRTY